MRTKSKRRSIAHSVGVFNRNDRSRGQERDPRGEGLYRGLSSGGCLRSIHTLHRTICSDAESRLHLAQASRLFSPKRPNPYSGSQVTATAECLSFSQARWSRTGILERCSRALTVVYTVHTAARVRGTCHRQEISYSYVKDLKKKKPLAGDEIACRFFVARSQLGSQRRCYSAVASRAPKVDRA